MHTSAKDGRGAVLFSRLFPVALIALPLVGFGSTPGPGADGSRRLIETSDGSRITRSWMTEEEIDDYSRRVHESGRCGGFMDVTDFQEKTAFFNPLRETSLRDRPIRKGDTVLGLFKELSADKFHGSVSSLSGFRNRYYQSDTGAQAAQWIANEFTRLAAGRNDITVEQFPHSFKQPSVIARIRGTDPSDKSVIILGAHEDSINHSYSREPAASRLAPGADDDASGVATILETFRVLAQSGFRPKRTIEFITYAGEERGLLGSQDIAQRYARDKREVAAVLQLDMTLAPGRSREILMLTDNVDSSLTQFTTRLIDTYVRVPWKTGECGYGCSDHASWHQAGYPSTLPFEAPMEEMNPRIHTEDDKLEYLDVEFGMHFTRLAVAFSVELSD